MSNNIIPQDIILSDGISIHNIIANGNYEIVSHSDLGCLILDKALLLSCEKRKLLQSYYLDTWPGAIQSANHIMPKLIKSIPIVTSSDLGYGLRYVFFATNKPDMVVMALEGMEKYIADKRRLTVCYTFEKPLEGYRYARIANVLFDNKTLPLFLNRYPQAVESHHYDKI